MDFRLSEEQQRLKDMAGRFARDAFGPTAFQHEEREGFLWDHARLLAENGFTGIDFPEEDGGQGGSLFDAMIVLDQVAQVDPHAADVVQAFNFGGIRQLQRLGSPDAKARWLGRALAGELLVSVAMTEPDAGSDLTRISTRARRQGSTVVLNGQKIFSSHGLDADLLIVWCRFAEGSSGIGAVVVPTDTEGFTRGPAEEYMSGERYCTMYFDDCEVPDEYILVDGDAFRQMMPVFNVERLGNATRSLALGELSFRLAVEHANQREVGPGVLRELQGIRWKFADMRMALDAAQLLLYRAAVDVDQDGFPTSENSSIAKCYANERAFEVANQSLQIFGGYGYTKPYPVEYIFRRTRGWMIAGGSGEVLRNRIARDVFRGSAK